MIRRTGWPARSCGGGAADTATIGSLVRDLARRAFARGESRANATSQEHVISATLGFLGSESAFPRKGIAYG